MPTESKENSIPSGTIVSNYRIIECLGSGGMGEVYLAEDTELRRKVALKLLLTRYAADAENKARFKKEAQAAAALDHPGIITIYEVSEYEGRPFFAMQHVEGQTLQDFAHGQELPLGQVLELAISISEGLEHAHRAGIVHRDIKPSNILIGPDGKPKILDFGVAAVRGDQRSTEDGSTTGTLGFMSPEQAQGEKVDSRSDLFSFGVLLYWLLTGKRPFTGEYEASIIYAIVNADPEPITALRPGIPVQLGQIITRLLEKKAENRYQNAADVLADLNSLLDGPVDDSGAFRPLRGPRTRRALIWSMVAVAIILVFGWWMIFHSGEKPVGTPKILAIMPFENLGSPEDEYFADGMTDQITIHLAKFGELEVIARSSSMQYKNTEKSLHEIGAELGASYILTGTIQWDKSSGENDVSINAKLVRVEDNTYLWADSYERVIDKVFALQSDIASNVTSALNVAVSRAEKQQLQARLTDNLEAYDLYLRGNEYFNRSWDREDIQIAIQFYERAVKLDSNFAAAYAMLSRGHGSMYSEYYDRSPQRLLDAKQTAHRALELSPGLAEGHLALGYCYYCELEYEHALAKFTIVRESQPNNRYVYNAIAAVYRRQGNLSAAVQNFIKALDLDPLSYLRAFDVALSFGMMRHYVEAEDYLDRTILLAPDVPLPYTYRAWLHILRDGDVKQAKAVLVKASGQADLARSKYYWWLVRIIETDYQNILDEMAPGPDTIGYYLFCAQMNRLMERWELERTYADSAHQLLESIGEEQKDQARFHSYLGLAYAGLRNKELALGHGQKAVELLPTSRETFDAPFLVVNLTETLVIFGEYDSAVEQLELLLSIPGFASIPYLKLDPLWVPLHNHPGFQRLLQADTAGQSI